MSLLHDAIGEPTRPVMQRSIEISGQVYFLIFAAVQENVQLELERDFADAP